MTNFIDYLLGGFSNGAVIALMALALVLVWRSTRMVNFAQVGQAMFTTYVALTIQQSSGNWLLALVVAIGNCVLSGNSASEEQRFNGRDHCHFRSADRTAGRRRHDLGW